MSDKTLKVKIRVIHEHIEEKPAKEVLMDILKEVRTDGKAEELLLYRDANDKGYITTFAVIGYNEMTKGDLKAVIECDTYDRKQKEKCCEILAKYADKFDEEYGITTYIDEEKSTRIH